MANDDAWASGWEAGQGKKNKKGSVDKQRPTQKALARQKAQAQAQPEPPANPRAFKKGGKVRKTGIAKVHKGERVLTAAQAKKCCVGKGKKGHKKINAKRVTKR